MSEREEQLILEKIKAIRLLVEELRISRDQRAIELKWFQDHIKFATKHDLEQMERNIMSVISQFAEKQKAFNDRQATAIDGLVSSTQGLTDDVKSLNDKITALQNSPGSITPEDQALLDNLQAQGESTASRAEAVSAALKALDEQTPPAVPPVA